MGNTTFENNNITLEDNMTANGFDFTNINVVLTDEEEITFDKEVEKSTQFLFDVLNTTV